MVFQNCLKFEISLVVFMPNIIHKSCYYLYKYIEKLVSLSSSEPPTGYPSENRNKHVGDSGKREKAGASTHFFSAQCPRHTFFYPSPQPPCDTMRSITCGKDEFNKHIRILYCRSYFADIQEAGLVPSLCGPSLL